MTHDAISWTTRLQILREVKWETSLNDLSLSAIKQLKRLNLNSNTLRNKLNQLKSLINRNNIWVARLNLKKILLLIAERNWDVSGFICDLLILINAVMGFTIKWEVLLIKEWFVMLEHFFHNLESSNAVLINCSSWTLYTGCEHTE